LYLLPYSWVSSRVFLNTREFCGLLLYLIWQI
jgi:hypothetical protein